MFLRFIINIGKSILMRHVGEFGRGVVGSGLHGDCPICTAPAARGGFGRLWARMGQPGRVQDIGRLPKYIYILSIFQ